MGQLLWQNNKGLFMVRGSRAGKGEPQPTRGNCPQSAAVERNTDLLFIEIQFNYLEIQAKGNRSLCVATAHNLLQRNTV